MVEYSENQLDAVFQALADATRRGMLASLSEQAQTVSSLAEPYDMSLAAASKHIKKLEAAGLVEREVVGRVHHCRLSPEKLKQASTWLKSYERFWSNRLGALEALLKAEDKLSQQQKTNKEGRDHADD